MHKNRYSLTVFRTKVLCKWPLIISVCIIIFSLIVSLWNYRYSNCVVYPNTQQLENCFYNRDFRRIDTDSYDVCYSEKFSKDSENLSFLLKAKMIEKHIIYDYLFEYQGVGYRLILFDFADVESAKTIFTSFVTEAKANIFKNTKVINPCEIPRKRQFVQYYTSGDLSGTSTHIWYDNKLLYILLSDVSEDESSIQTASNIKIFLRGD